MNNLNNIFVYRYITIGKQHITIATTNVSRFYPHFIAKYLPLVYYIYIIYYIYIYIVYYTAYSQLFAISDEYSQISENNRKYDLVFYTTLRIH